MSRPRATGWTTLCLLLSCRIAIGTDLSQATQSSVPPQSLQTSAPATVGPADIGNTAATPSLMALPAEPAPTAGGIGIAPADAANTHKFYTFSVELRETYDDNVGTSDTNKQSALETSLAPSVLVDFPMGNTEFSAGYTFTGTYYSQTAGTGKNLQYSHIFTANFKHDFSERFSLNLADSLIDSPDPNLYGTTGTPYRNGQNLSNAFNGGLSAQWTPILGTQTTYANTIVRYLNNPDEAAAQDNEQNTVSQTFSFTVVPTFSVNFGGIFDTINYDQNPRGYDSYTGFIGGSWTALPNLTLSLRVGGSYTLTDQLQADGTLATQSQVAPYVDLSGSWQIGQRSSLTADYSHETTPSDYFGSNAAESDRVSATFNYLVTTQLSTHLQLAYTYSDISGADLYFGGTPSYTETVYSGDVGASYNFIKYFSLNFDINVSGVSSEIAGRDYNRDQVSFGVRGTY